MLKERIKTGVIGLTFLLITMSLFEEYVFRLIIASVFMIAAWEWFNLIKETNRFLCLANTVIFFLLGCYYQANNFTIEHMFIFFSLSLLFWFFCLILLFFYPIRYKNFIPIGLGYASLITGYIALDWIYLFSSQYLFAFLCLIWAMDIGAYFTGKKFGKIKLAKSISPNKTWEGLIGGLVSTIMLSFLISKIIYFDAIMFAFFSISLGLISVVGDLTVSMFKRNSNQKDTGKILPGHGGLLDRIDSIISSAPLFALGCIYFLF